MQQKQVAGICVTNPNLEYICPNVVTNKDVYNEPFILNTFPTNLLQLYVGLVCEVTLPFIDIQYGITIFGRVYLGVKTCYILS